MTLPRSLLPLILLCAATTPTATPAHTAQDLMGIWTIQPPSPPGVLVIETFAFSTLNGAVTASYHRFGVREQPDTAPIHDITVRSNTVTFKVGEDGAIQLWKGSFQDASHLQMAWFSVDASGQAKALATRTLLRLTPDQLSHSISKLPHNLVFHKLPLPHLRDLPPNGLAPTPTMGWSSWNHFMETIDDATVRQTADRLVSTGLRDAGYTLVEVDDGWQGARDASGSLHPNSKFPDMKALGDYLHAKGLQFGIYTAPGPTTCAGYWGSHGYETQDAATFASWGVDFVMNDFCSAYWIYPTYDEMRALHQKMAEALRATGRPIEYKVHDAINIFDEEHTSWGRKVGANLWRTGLDLVTGDRWKSVSDRFDRHGNPEDAAPGGWNDADNLVIGVPGVLPGDRALTMDESRTHLTLWAILASPLILGNDIRTMTPEIQDLLLNREVIAIDQDRLGKQGRRIVRHDDTEIWTKPLSDGSLAVAVFNRRDATAKILLTWKDLGLKGPQSVRDLWHHADLGEQPRDYSARVPSHGALLLRLQAIE
jgi:alpha-galactosidase